MRVRSLKLAVLQYSLYWCRRTVRNIRGPKVLCMVFGFSINSSTIDRKAKNHAKNFRPTDIPHSSATPIWRMTTVVKQISHVGETQELFLKYLRKDREEGNWAIISISHLLTVEQLINHLNSGIFSLTL